MNLKFQSKDNMEAKLKYYYSQDIYTCVLCGVEYSYKYRVYDKSKAGRHYFDDACGFHFM